MDYKERVKQNEIVSRALYSHMELILNDISKDNAFPADKHIFTMFMQDAATLQKFDTEKKYLLMSKHMQQTYVQMLTNAYYAYEDDALRKLSLSPAEWQTCKDEQAQVHAALVVMGRNLPDASGKSLLRSMPEGVYEKFLSLKQYLVDNGVDLETPEQEMDYEDYCEMEDR